MTPAEQWREEGREEGRAEGLRDLLVSLLRRQFGDVPGEATGRIAAADESQLSKWIEGTLRARTIAEALS